MYKYQIRMLKEKQLGHFATVTKLRPKSKISISNRRSEKHKHKINIGNY